VADKAYITPGVLKWARESARMTEEVAAAKVPTTIERVKEWETGISQPSISQAQKLAKAYKRPFAVLFLPEPPRDFQTLQDFRTKDSKLLSTSSIFIIREIQQKQAWISEANKENREAKSSFVGKFTTRDNPVDVSKDILFTLGINPANYSTNNPIKEWIDKAESKGIFISRTSFIHSRLKLDSDELQGFAIADPYAPFIFINSDDWSAPQLFTLVHELAHIWIAASGVSNNIESDLTYKDRLHPIELFCNEVAANALIPFEIINNNQSTAFKSAKELFEHSKKLGVSSFAFLVRALNLNLISSEKYKSLKQAADAEYKAFLKREVEKKVIQQAKKGDTGPSYYLLQLNKNSRLFTQTVLDAFRGGFIEPTLASTLLNVQVNKFHKLEAQLYK
jgi:Zn-dependent peptidase ImmA (M78 family)/transcriptional regulator with XRE-family HTH domain